MARKKIQISEKEKFKKMMQDDDAKLLITIETHFQGFLNEFYTDYIQAIDRLHCNQCLDLKNNLCPGMDLQGEEVFSCMQEQASCSIFHID